jgi:hypothetical protein
LILGSPFPEALQDTQRIVDEALDGR